MIFKWSDNWRTSTKPEIQQPVLILHKTHAMNDQQVNRCRGLDYNSVDMPCAYTGQSQIFQRARASHPLFVLAGLAGLAGRIHRRTVYKAFQSEKIHPFSTAVKIVISRSIPIKFVSASAIRPFFPWQLFHFEVNISFFPVKFQSLAFHLKDIYNIRR